VTKPNGSVVNGSSVASISFAADIAGPYNVLLTVTDDEGVQAQTSLGFDVDPRSPRSGSPGEEPTSCRNCGDSKVQACTFASRGNNQISWRDPVATRGYPLRNRIFINSQSLFPTRTTDLGNASFSYGIEILTATINGTPRRFVIDGNGTELDFGPTSGAPTGEPGVFSVLTVNQNSYTLSGAGAPESIHEAGNFTYEFNSNGQLTSLTDPSGNTQALTYNSEGDLSLVTDLSSGRILTFEYDTPGQVTRIVENGGVAITHLTYSSGL